MTKRRRARRTEDKQQRRDDILDAAERMIARHGLTNVTFGHVARKSRLSRSLIYVYFPTWEDLVYAICERGLKALQKRLEQAAQGNELGIDRILAMARAYKTFSEEEALYFKVISELEAKGSDPATMGKAEESTTECARQVLGLVAETVRHGIKDGSVRSQSNQPMLTALSVWAFTHGLIQISTTKRHMLEDDFNLSSGRLLNHGFQVLRNALSTGTAPERPAKRRRRAAPRG